jgi:ABC-2 type transport system ATP-binding protein
VHDPLLLLLDEPTNGLDPQGIADVRQLLLHLSREKGITILISSHLLHEVELIADRMLIIDRGKKIRDGRVKELFDSHAMQVAIEVENTGAVSDALTRTRWQQHLVEANENGLQFQVDKGAIPSLINDLVGMQARIVAVRTHFSLEDQFLKLTGK